MDPSIYVPAYLEHNYALAHPGLTPAGRELLHDEVLHDPDAYAADEHARSLVAYTRVHTHLMDELNRLEDTPSDEEFDQARDQLFFETHLALVKIWTNDHLCVDAHLVDILLSGASLDDCLGDLMALEQSVREFLQGREDGFDVQAPHFWMTDDADEAARRTSTDPVVIGWLHVLDCIAQGCLMTARYRAAAQYAHMVMRSAGYPNETVGTLLLALARLEDEEGFFQAAEEMGEAADDSPWFLLARTVLFYKLDRMKSARRALRDFAARCEGGAFFLLNPTYHAPYLPDRPAPRETWDRSHQAVWEADWIISDIPDFAGWAMTVDGVEDASEAFARRYGF